METPRERKQKRRNERIQRSAIELFSSQGFEATTMGKIADLADLAVGTLYNYYPSKGDLLLSIISDRSHVFIDSLESKLKEPGDSVVEAIMYFFENYLESFSVYPKLLWREFLGFALSKEPKFMSHIADIDSEFIQLLSQLLVSFQKKGLVRSEVDTNTATLTLYNVLFAQLHVFVANSEMTLDHLKESLRASVEFIFIGLVAS
ncbi:TetR/AcrR family transcriptional regulator [bacterium]|nr:TetR/AcrR family transcriptional regulator [bacterium]